jgi:hypothetical protein
MTYDRQSTFEPISAFIDGESVDPHDLAKVLSVPGAREALVDFILLREELKKDDRMPNPDFYEGIRKVIPASLPGRLWSRTIRIPLVAAALLVALVTGLVGGLTLFRRPAEDVPPPYTERVMTFEPGVDWHTSDEENGQ